MKNFDSFDRKSFRQQKINSKNKHKKSNNFDDEYRVSKLKNKNIKKKIQDLQEEELWQSWEDETY
jgi:hypothetical protein